MTQMISVRDKKVHTRPGDWVEVAVGHEHLPLQEQNWSERWCTLPKIMADHLEPIIGFEVRDDDVFLVGFTKSGTTWLQETVWLLVNQLDFERAQSTDLLERTSVLEFEFLNSPKKEASLEFCEAMPSPRLIKSHMPASLLPKQIWEKKQKIIYVARNAKDVFVSCYHFFKGLGAWKGEIDQHVHAFVNDELMQTPYWSHVVEFWKLRHESHIFFVTYEEMQQDLADVIQRLCDFLERPQLTEAEMKQTLEHLVFDKMSANKHLNSTDFFKKVVSYNAEKDFQFMRRGIVGSYKDELTENHQAILNNWIEKSLGKFNLKEEDIFGNV